MAWLITVLTLATPSVLIAQQAAGPGPRRAPVFASAPVPPALADTVMRIRPTHWATGAAIGGVGLGLVMGVLAVGLCGMNDAAGGPGAAACFASGLLGGGLTGAAIGALIGGQFPKREAWEPAATP